MTITRAPSVGTRLFERDTRGTVLTPAGEAFLPEALGVLSAARAAAASARAAAVPERIIVGHVAALLVTPAVRALRAARPHAEVRTLHLGWREPRPALLARRVDVAVARLPFPTEGLRIRPLYDELRVLLVARPPPGRPFVDPTRGHRRQRDRGRARHREHPPRATAT